MTHLRKIGKIGAVLSVAAILAAAPVSAISPGQIAPEFKLPGKAGPVQLSSLRGKLVYVDFWASWCGPCKQSFPWLNEMQAKYGAAGFEVVGVNLDNNREDAEKSLQSTSPNFTIAYDTRRQTPDKYAVRGMPSSVLVGPDGKVLYVHAGFDESQKGALEARIKAALPRR